MKFVAVFTASVILVASAGAQEVAKPAGEAAVAGTGGEVEANRAALTTVAGQTAQIIRDREANARNLASYAEAQAEYKRNVERYETERTAVARKTVEDAEAYRVQIAAWRRSDHKRQRPAPSPAAVPAAATSNGAAKRVCGMEQPTGSAIPVRVCHSR